VVAGFLVLAYLFIGLVNLASNDTNLTHQLAKEIDSLGHVKNEFQDSRDHGGLVRGLYVGESKIDGKPHHHLQFDGALAGDGRFLDIHFAHEQFDDATISEADRRLEGEDHAFLLVRQTCCLDQDAWYELFELDVGDTTSPVDLFQRRFDYVIEDPPADVFFAHFDFSNIFDFSTRWIQWKRGDGGTWEVVGRGASIQQSYDLDVEWVQRDRSEIRRKKAGYAWTGPVDVLIWPFQVLLLLAYGMGGGL
jgi:hypothetical protein